MHRECTLSGRGRTMPASPIRRLAPLAVEAAARGVRVHHLNIGQPDIPAPAEILRRLKTFSQTNLAYGPSQGLPEFIETVRRYHERRDLRVASGEIFVTTGGSEALLFALAAVADPGDDVLVFEPFYTNYDGFARLVGVRTVPVPTLPEEGYHLPPADAIRSKITPRTRAVLLCSPNNPTGTVYTDAELEAVAEICRDHGLFLVSDEVYREFTYDGRRHRSALTLEGMDEHVILVDSLSKRVSMCGARVGWIVTRNREVLDAVLRFGQARLCPPTLEQYLGIGLDDVPESYIAGVIEEYQQRRDLVYEALAAIPGVTVRKPEGAFYLCAGLPVDDAQGFAEFLLRDFAIDGETTMIAPADGFYATPGRGRREARIAYVLDRERLARAMRVLAEGLKAYPGSAGPGTG
jgi:aspartate aminotransferase